MLARYPFPGNVRELENILERTLALLAGEAIDADDLNLAPVAAESAGELLLQDHLDRVERDAILEALQKTRFNRTAAARLLGVTFRSLRYRMERLGLKE
jgi:two-component system response regulator PilR (NtrC family)